MTLVAIGLASFSGELAIALGGIVLLLTQGRWRRIPVMAVPILLFLIWDAQDQPPGTAGVTIDHIGGLSLFELMPKGNLGKRQWIAVGVVLAFALLTNVVALRNGTAILRAHGEADRATLAALELQARRAEANPTLRDTPMAALAGFSDSTQSDLIYITAGEYLRAADRFGSAAYLP